MNRRFQIFLFNEQAATKVMGLLVAGATLFGAGCSGNRLTRLAKKQTITVTPNPLEVHGGKVSADLTINVPPEILTTGYTYAAEIIYTIPGSKTKPGQLLRVPFVRGEFVPWKDRLTASKTITIPWQPGQENGFLKVRGVFNKDRDYQYLPYQNVAQGFITTFQLAVPEEHNPYISSPYTRKEEQNSYVFYFNHNSAGLKSYAGADSGPLADFIALNNQSKLVRIGALQSPDEEAGMAKKRAEAAKEYYIKQVDRNTYRGESGKIKFDLMVIPQNEQQLLEEIKKSPMPDEQKADLTGILEGKGSYPSKLKQLRKLSSYKYLQDYIFPMLRRANMQAVYERPQKMNFEIALTAMRIAKGEVDADMLTADEFAFAAELTPLMEEKETLYKAAARIHKRPQDAYNLGVFYLEKAKKERNPQYRKEYYEAAIQKFRDATGTFNTPKVYYNLATAYHLSGNTDLANQYYDVTARLQGGEEFTQKVISARAAMLVKAGQYDEAARVLKTAGEGYSANISRGLVAIYKQNYTDAVAALTQAASVSPDQGLPYYLQAVTGARSGNEELVFTSLKQAVQKDRNYVEKALDDLEFRNYKQKPGFRDAVK